MAITDSMIQTAMSHLRAGNRGEAAKVLRDVMSIEPGHIRATSMLSVIIYQDGDPGRALAMLNELEAKNPQKPEIVRARTEILLGTGDLEAALAAQSQACMLNPKDPSGHLQEGILLERLGRREEALAAAEQALAIDPGLVGTRQLLASLYMRTGRIEEATELYLGIRAQAEGVADPNHHLALGLLVLGRSREIADLKMGLSQNQRFGEIMVQAIGAWLGDDPERCALLLRKARSLGRDATMQAPNRRLFLTYLAILEALTSWREDHPDAYSQHMDRELHIVGDSHVLTAANLSVSIRGNTTKLRSHLVYGCKIWHIVRDEPSAQRGYFDAVAARIPEGSTVVTAFGELDIRLKEGIMRALRSDPSLDWRSMADDLVTRYLDHMATLAQAKTWTLWVQSPPMSNIATFLLISHQRDVFLGLIERFNTRLREETARRALPLVDLNAITTAQSGQPRREHYIDTNHTYPDVLIEALAAMV